MEVQTSLGDPLGNLPRLARKVSGRQPRLQAIEQKISAEAEVPTVSWVSLGWAVQSNKTQEIYHWYQWYM